MFLPIGPALPVGVTWVKPNNRFPGTENQKSYKTCVNIYVSSSLLTAYRKQPFPTLAPVSAFRSLVDRWPSKDRYKRDSPDVSTPQSSRRLHNCEISYSQHVREARKSCYKDPDPLTLLKTITEEMSQDSLQNTVPLELNIPKRTFCG